MYAAGNIAMAAFMWDSVDDPEVAPTLRDCAHLAQVGRAPTMAAWVRILEGVIRVMRVQATPTRSASTRSPSWTPGTASGEPDGAP